MLRFGRWVIYAVALVGVLAGCSASSDQRAELLVFAAASLADALGEVEAAFEAQGQVDVAVSYGASQMLAQQIASGAPADMFISAGRFPVRFLADKGLIEPVGADLLTNRLVVAVRASGNLQMESLDQLNTPIVERISIADPELAPAGRYVRESLMHLRLWDEVHSKLVFGPDVRATLAYVESSNVDAAIVYVTDARAGRNIEVLDIVPPGSYSPIRYPAVIVTKSEQKVGAAEFLDFLRSEQAREIFRRHGFVPAE